MAVNDGGAAFPWGGEISGGMSLRDYFAANADISQYTPAENLRNKLGRDPTVSELAQYIVTIRHIEADAMLAERAKNQEKGE